MQGESGTISPASPEIEKSILASCLVVPECLDEIVDSLDNRAFYRGSHKHFFDAIAHLHKKDAPVDTDTISSYLQDKELSKVAPLTELAMILDHPVSINLKHNIRILREKQALRRTIEVCNAGMKRASDSKRDPEETLEWLKKETEDLEIDPNLDSRMKSVADLAGETIERYEKISSGEIMPGILPGFSRLNSLMKMEPGDIIFLAGRPSMGKTALVLNMILKSRLDKTMPKTAFFSLEQSHGQIMDRMVAIKTGLDLQAIGNAFFVGDDGWKKVEACLGWLYEQPIYIDDTPALTVQQIKSRSRRIKRKHGLELIVIDYLQLLTSSVRRDGNRNLEVGKDSRDLKALAKELELPVLVVSQLSRNLERRPNPNKVPMLSDLRDSGEIEQVADKVMFIYRPEVYNDTENEEFPNQANVYLAKQRQGPIGVDKLLFDISSVRFQDVDRNREVK